MKISLFNLTLFGGTMYASHKLYINKVRRAPPSPNLHEKQNKKIVVIGAGIVGLTTAYYLSQYEDNEVILIEKHNKCA